MQESLSKSIVKMHVLKNEKKRNIIVNLTCFSSGCDTLSEIGFEFDLDVVVYGISFLMIGSPNIANGSFWFNRSSCFEELSCESKEDELDNSHRTEDEYILKNQEPI